MNKAREKTYEEKMDEARIRLKGDYLNRRESSRLENNSPYRAVLVDQFEGYCEDGYGVVGAYTNLDSAIEVARKATEEGIRHCGTFDDWRGMGDAGLVYDSKRQLVWDGVREYEIIDENQKLFRAVEFATGAHYGQFRKGTNIPYIVHPLGVAKILIENNCSNEVIVAGVLHDVLEDTSVTYENLKESFGVKIAEIVKGVTEPDKSASWFCRKLHTVEYLETAPWNVLLVACADKLDNTRAMRADYKKEGEGFWKRFNASKESQEWYYRSLVEVFSPYAKDSVFSSLFRLFIKEVRVLFRKSQRGQPPVSSLDYDPEDQETQNLIDALREVKQERQKDSPDAGKALMEAQEKRRKLNLPDPD